MSKKNRGLRVYLSPGEREQLAFICAALGTKPSEFLRSIVPVHYNELNNIIENQLKEATGERAADKAQPASGEEVPQPEG